MQALLWDGRELRLDASYPSPEFTPTMEDGGSKIVEATGSRPAPTKDRTAVVKVHLAGVCSTDLQIFKGYMGFKGVPGHEFADRESLRAERQCGGDQPCGGAGGAKDSHQTFPGRILNSLHAGFRVHESRAYVRL